MERQNRLLPYISHQGLKEVTTKRALACEIAKMYDVLGWFAPSVIRAKVLLQQLWECGVA
jgi:hypothetical protein